MKVKFSLIPFILAMIAMVGLKLMSLYGLDGNGMFLGMNKMGIAYAVIGISLALLVVCIIINLFDRKTSPVYPVKKNFVAGIFSVLAGVSVAGSSITTFLNTTSDSDYYLMSLVCVLFSIPAAIALVVMSKVHFTGKSSVSGVSMLFVFPALWGCAELVSEFLAATKVSISASDMTLLFCYIFITLYYFYHSMIVSRIKGRNPVKACFIYGLPAVAISLAYGIYVICTSAVEGFSASQVFIGANLIVFAVYALSFIVEMAFNSYTKDEIEILDGLPDDEDTYENSYVKSGGYDELVFSERNADDDSDDAPKGDSVPALSGLDDFIIGFDSETDEKPITYVGKNDTEDKDTSDFVFNQNSDSSEKGALDKSDDVEHTSDIKDSSDEENSTEKKLSDIDLLLQELDNKK